MQNLPSGRGWFLASISAPSMAVLVVACVVLALMRKDDLLQGLARVVVLLGAATAAVWLSWKLSSADWWTAAMSLFAYALSAIAIVLGANGLARILWHTPYDSGHDAIELLLELNPFAVIGGAIAVLGIFAIFFVDWLAVAAVLAAFWVVVVGALLLAQFLSMSILDEPDETAEANRQRGIDETRRKVQRRLAGNDGAPVRRGRIAPRGLLRGLAACSLALVLGLGASALMLRS